MAAKKGNGVEPGGAPGLGIDYAGAPAIDPSENVKALGAAAAERQDDLRELTNTYLLSKIDCARENGTLRADHVKEIGVMRAAHAKEIGELETNRLKMLFDRLTFRR